MERVQEEARLARLLRKGCAFRLELESPWGLGRILSGPGHRGWAACLLAGRGKSGASSERWDISDGEHAQKGPANRKTRWSASEYGNPSSLAFALPPRCPAQQARDS